MYRFPLSKCSLMKIGICQNTSVPFCIKFCVQRDHSASQTHLVLVVRVLKYVSYQIYQKGFSPCGRRKAASDLLCESSSRPFVLFGPSQGSALHSPVQQSSEVKARFQACPSWLACPCSLMFADLERRGKKRRIEYRQTWIPPWNFVCSQITHQLPLSSLQILLFTLILSHLLIIAGTFVNDPWFLERHIRAMWYPTRKGKGTDEVPFFFCVVPWWQVWECG